jgi:uncharacterized protein
MTPVEHAPPRRPVWGWEDVVLLLGAVLPAFFVGMGLMRLLRWLAPTAFGIAAVTTLTFQLFVYALLVGALFSLISWKYGEPFWPALGFKFAFRGAVWIFLAGPALAAFVDLLGIAIRTPVVRDPIREMIKGRVSLALVITFGVLIAPFVEELFFRGFLLPLIARSIGPWPSIVTTAILFALAHGAQNEWAWQELALIGLAGVAFGFVRVRTGATSASFLMHAGFNATQFLSLLISRQAQF